MATATYTPIASQTLGSAAASITFSSIPGTYTDLRLVLTGTVSVADNVCIQFNSDTATNYSMSNLTGNGTSSASGNFTSQPRILLNNISLTSTIIPQVQQMDFMSYAGATNKTVLVATSNDYNGSGSVELNVGLWRSTAAITTIKLFLAAANNFSTGTIATLFGI